MPLLKEQRVAASKLAVELGVACEETGCRPLGEVSAALHNGIDERRGQGTIAELVAAAREAVDAAGTAPDELSEALDAAEAELARPARGAAKGKAAAKAQTTAPKPAPKPAPKRRGRPPKAKAITPKPAPPARPDGEVLVRLPLAAVADLAAAGWTVKLERG